MAAPMGNYQTYGRTPKAALVVDRSLRESGPGVFSIKTQVPAEGMYDVAFYLDSPRVVHCFSLAVRSNPALKKLAVHRVNVQSLMAAPIIQVNEPVELKFKLTDPATGKAHANLTDVRIVAFLAPGVWQRREMATASGDGVYTLTASVPEPGIYYVFVESPSLGLRLNAQRPVILQAVGAEVSKGSP
jgi:hypothetical protein